MARPLRIVVAKAGLELDRAERGGAADDEKMRHPDHDARLAHQSVGLLGQVLNVAVAPGAPGDRLRVDCRSRGLRLAF